ncbi:MAG: exosortase [Acetobacteraceae bacterium]|nr:exosortase [Acetobacteraceae bacterium]
MSSNTIAQPALAETWHDLRGPAAALGFGLLLLGGLFQAEIEAAVRIWNTSTAYNHCFLVIPIAGYLVWDRREALRGLTAHPLPWAALLALPLAAVWLIAERLGIMEGRQLVLITLVQVLVLAVLGWRAWWVLSGPLLYLYFLVPFGEFMVPKLQDVTTVFVRHGLDLLQIPAYIDGYVIEIPEGTFFIAEACAGLRFLIASIAFGCLYALMMYRSPGRRAAFIAVSIVIPVIANGLRALGIVWLGHVIGSAQAAAADHIIYGWIFFSIVILLLILVGLPFRQDDHPEAPPLHDRAPVAAPLRGALIAALALALLAAAGPGTAQAIDRGAAAGQTALRPFDLGPACRTVSSHAEPSPIEGGQLLVQRIACGDMTLELRVARFSPRSTAAPLLAARRRLTRTESADEAMIATTRGAGDAPPQWRVVQVSEPAFAIASALWVDGQPAGAGLAMRLRMAWHSLAGGLLSPVVVAVTPVVDWAALDVPAQRAAVSRLTEFLQADGTIGAQAQVASQATSQAQ